MKNVLIAAGILAVILVGGAAFFSINLPNSMPGLSMSSVEPQAQTERLTSFFLLKKIEDMRDKAVYLQHREEGRKLLELTSNMVE